MDMRTLLVGAIGIIVGLSLLISLPAMVNPMIQRSSTTDTLNLVQVAGAINESDTYNYTVSKVPSGWRADGGCALTNFAINNATAGNPLVITTDYTVNLETGKFALINNADVNLTDNTYGLFPENKTYVSYSYCGDEYISLGWARILLGLIIGLFALSIIGGSVALVIKSFENSNLVQPGVF
jgi:hypothetical protein